MSAGIATMADVVQLEAVPLTELGLPHDVLGVLERGRERSDGRDALVFLPDASRPEQVTRYSYDTLIDLIERAAAGLGSISGAGPIVSILLPNLPETHVALLASQTIGCANPINPLLDASAIADIMLAAGATVAITLAPLPGQELFAKLVAAAASVPSLKAVAVVDPVPHLGRTEAMLSAARAMAPELAIYDFADLPRSDGSPPRERGGNDVAALFHTGGTTGAPKIAQLTHTNQVFTAWSANANRTMERHRTIFGGLPLFHVNGALVTGLVPWFTGATVLLGPPEGFRASALIQNFWRIVERHRVGAMSAVPTVYAMLAQQPLAEADVSSLEFCICGAAPIGPELIGEFERATGAPILEGYGLTEGACVSTINPGYGERRPGSVGLRSPYQRIAILERRNEAWVQVAHGAVGLVVLSGPNVFAGYLRPEDDAKAWIELDGDRWYDTGDLGRFDSDGYLWLAGRRKELIIRGGHNIDPAVIEEALTRHPGVQLAAAVGAPDERLGEIPVAYVQLATDTQLDEHTLLEFAGSNIFERAAVPKRIHFVPQMPLTSIGKVFKPELKRREVERLARVIVGRRFPEVADALVIRLDRERGMIAVLRSGDALTAAENAELQALLRTLGIGTTLVAEDKALPEEPRCTPS